MCGRYEYGSAQSTIPEDCSVVIVDERLPPSSIRDVDEGVLPRQFLATCTTASLCYDLHTASVTTACATHCLHYCGLCYLQMGTIGKPHMARLGFTSPTSTTDQCESSTTNTVLRSGVVLRRGCKPSPHGDKQATSVSANKWYGGPDTVGQCVKLGVCYYVFYPVVVLRRGFKPSPTGDKQGTSVTAARRYGGPGTTRD